MASIAEQIRRHSVALISLFVALSGLAYNTWRNEQTEENNNIRTAGIEMLLLLGEFDREVFHLHFDSLGNARTGWSLVLTIRDLGTLIREPAAESSEGLVGVWQVNWENLGERNERGGLTAESQESFNSISNTIEVVRKDVRDVMSALD